MVRNVHFLLGVVAMFSAVCSCTKQEINDALVEKSEKSEQSESDTLVGPRSYRTIVADIEQPTDEAESKLILDGTTFSWEAGDSIALLGFTENDGSAFDPTKYSDADHPFPSNLKTYQYKFKAQSSGTTGVKFTSEDEIPDAVKLLYAVYPYTAAMEEPLKSKDDYDVSWRSNIKYKSKTDGTIKDGGILISNSLLNGGRFVFRCPSTIIKLTIPNDYPEIQSIMLRRDDATQYEGLVGVTYTRWYRKTVDSKFKGNDDFCSYGTIYDLSVENGDTGLSGDVYFCVRGISSYKNIPFLFKVVRKDGKVGFLKTVFKSKPGEGKLISMGLAAPVKWYDTETVTYEISDGTTTWSTLDNIFGEYIPNVGATTIESQFYEGGEHDFSKKSDGYSLRIKSIQISAKNTWGLRVSRTSSDFGDYIALPALKGMKLSRVDIGFGSQGSGEYTNGGISVVNPDMSAITVTTKGDSKTVTMGEALNSASHSIRSHSWDFLGSPGAGWGGTNMNVSYRFKCPSIVYIRNITLQYIGDKVLRADCVKTLSGGQCYNTNYSDRAMTRHLAISGQFVPKNYGDSQLADVYDYGFEYRLLSQDSSQQTETWAEVDKSSCTLNYDGTTGIATINSTIEVDDLGVYEYRARVKVSGDSDWNYGCNEVSSLKLDFASKIAYSATTKGFALMDLANNRAKFETNVMTICPWTVYKKYFREIPSPVKATKYYGCFANHVQVAGVDTVQYQRITHDVTFETKCTFGLFCTYAFGLTTGNSKVTGILFNYYQTDLTKIAANKARVQGTDGRAWLKLPAYKGRKLLGVTFGANSYYILSTDVDASENASGTIIYNGRKTKKNSCTVRSAELNTPYYLQVMTDTTYNCRAFSAKSMEIMYK